MIGEKIHSYEINAHLGQGGMGNVFRATDSMLGREVALKMLHPQLTMQPQFLERFKKEARVLAQLLHPNIAVIYNFIEQEGNHYMVMEYVEGTNLDDLLKMYKVLPAEFVVPVFIQALEGLHHAHRKNIFHRDIKPANLMLTEEGVVKLMDFGIAKIAGEQKLTQVNKIVGTIEFMAPELLEGKEPSPASDIYSMGATLYELISGKIPFEGDTDFNLMQAILKSKVKAPDKFTPGIPKALNDIVLKAMDRNPAHRFASAKDFQQALMKAFPSWRDIDKNVLVKVQQSIRSTRLATNETMQGETRLESITSAATRMDTNNPLSLLQGYKDKLYTNRKYALLLLIFLGLTIIMAFVIKMNNSKPRNVATNKADSIQATPVIQTTIPTEGDSNISPASAAYPPQEDHRIIVPSGPVSEAPTLPGETQKPHESKKTISKDQPVKQVEKSTLPEKEAIEKIIPPVAEKKDVYISSGVTISLSLKTMPDLNQKKKEAQNVSFLVSSPVFYDGVLIVKQGAIATGFLTIGSKRTDITITQVEAANGKSILLKSTNAHGRRDDISVGERYSATILPGVRLAFQ